jgi:hypothetical protein
MTFELEYLERDCEMTVLPQPKAPGMAVVPPCTQLQTLLIVVIENQVNNKLGNAASASLCVCGKLREQQTYGNSASSTR